MRHVRSPLAPQLALTGLAVVLVLAACGSPSSQEDGRPVVLTTTTVFADLLQQIGGDAVQVRSLVPIGGDPHVFEPRPSDAVAIQQAALVVDGGLGLSPWLAPMLRPREGPVLDLGDSVVAAAVIDADGVPDPHVWMVPTLVAETYLPVMTDALTRLAPDQADAIAGRAEALAGDLQALDADIAAILAPIPDERRLLVTSHDAYTYFADAYDLRVVGTVVGISTEEQPSARTVAALIDQIEELQVPAVFIETTVNPDVIQRIARDSGVDVGAPLYGDSLGPPGSGAETYADMLRTNARHIAEALS